MREPVDYIGHVPVTLFKTLDISIGENIDDFYFYIMDGNYYRYKVGDKLPLRGLIYKYPKDFFIVTPGNDSMCLVVKDGIYRGIADINKTGNLPCPVYDTYGNLLNVYTYLDILSMKTIYEYRLMENDKEGFNKSVGVWTRPTEIQGDHSLNVFARYVAMFPQMRFESERVYHLYKISFKRFLESQKEDAKKLAERYKLWLEEELIPFKDIDKIIELTLEEKEGDD